MSPLVFSYDVDGDKSSLGVNVMSMLNILSEYVSHN